MTESMETAIRSSIFTLEHETLRASVRAFVERELAPHAEEWEAAGDFPASLRASG